MFLDENPDGRLLADKIIEESSKEYLGYDSSANRQEEEIKKQDIVQWQNENPVQYKKVPRLI